MLDPNRGAMQEEAQAEELERDIQRRKEQVAESLAHLKSEKTLETSPLTNRRRKNHMRNKPCLCGSGKKFKKCCWSKVL